MNSLLNASIVTGNLIGIVQIVDAQFTYFSIYEKSGKINKKIIVACSVRLM